MAPVTPSTDLRGALDWGRLAPLRLRARTVAAGVYAGGHRSRRRGSGVEFGGHRDYVLGDDLRRLDHRAFLRHGRLLVREFETETDRTLRLVVDASRSMAYRSPSAPGAKLAFAALVAAALARIALSSGDPVGLDWVGGERRRPLPALAGREAFERIVSALEVVEPSGDLTVDHQAVSRAIAPIARHASRGSVVVFLSDLVDLPEDAAERIAALATKGRTVIAARVLDPAEAEFPFAGPVRLRASEGSKVIETDASAARSTYLAALEQQGQRWQERLLPRGGALVTTVTTTDPVEVVRAILSAVRGLRP
ncbi:MAG: DUF58 domain-containing protein [Polyangiaceae bacterium]|nr:DUF58 domain-containing protein [Polyangiaceae bacterium]